MVGVREVVDALRVAAAWAEGAHTNAIEMAELRIRGRKVGRDKACMLEWSIAGGPFNEDVRIPEEQRVPPLSPELHPEVNVADSSSKDLRKLVDLEWVYWDCKGPIKIPRKYATEGAKEVCRFLDPVEWGCGRSVVELLA
jgi:hypothetical protein